VATGQRVLFITSSFPPDAEVGGKRVARLCRYLPEFSIHPIVLTVAERFYRAVDRSYPVPQDIELIRTPVIRTPLTWYGDWARRRAERRTTSKSSTHVRQTIGKGAEKPPNPDNALRVHVRALLAMPNEIWEWYWHAMRAGEKLLRRGGISTIVSSAPPWTCHVIARDLKRKFGLPWIADFRDAWTFEPWRPRVPKWRDRMDSCLESSIVHEADRVISVVEGVRDEFTAKYSDINPERFLTIPNGFEGEVQIAQREKYSPRLILHLGSLYGGRRIDTFCQAISNVIERGSISHDALRIEFVGGMDPAIRASADHHGARLLERGILHFRERVPFEEGQSLLGNADLLLVFQGNHRFSVTAKVYEYMATGTPILAVAKTGAISALLSENTAGFCADPDDIKAVEAAFMRAWEMPRLSSDHIGRIADRYHFRNLASRFAKTISQISCAKSNS
jgi:glycosyltransferase involved in cell wall biosynthesis